MAMQRSTDPTLCHASMGMLVPDCKRPVHHAPPGIDEEPVCLMHSKDPAKLSGDLTSAFWLEFDSTIESAGDGYAYFTGFVFPYIRRGAEFKANCIFDNAVFTSFVHFSGMLNFPGGASFKDAHFNEGVNLELSTLGGPISFEGATFHGTLRMTNASFEKYVSFRFTKFLGDATITANFAENADFHFTTFEGEARFLYCTFNKEVDFTKARFKDKAVFFSGFKNDAWFIESIFERSAEFAVSNFSQADFRRAQFHSFATWENCGFSKGAVFSGTQFSSPDLALPQASFALATFDSPDSVVFHDVDLSRTLFNNCDISDIRFTSSVRWDTAPRHRARLYNDRKAVLYDEIVPYREGWTDSLFRDGERDYKAVAQAYQRLKKNYDGQLDYWTANEFHYGEMEMQRCDRPTTGPILALRRWWHPRLSFKAWYRYASDYGNNYSKPMHWLIAVLIVFALLVPVAGLQRNDTSKPETYYSVWKAATSPHQRLRWETGLIGKSLLTAVDTATFQKGAEYTPAYPWGRALAIVETLLTSTLFALFLLAVRRQFRR